MFGEGEISVDKDSTQQDPMPLHADNPRFVTSAGCVSSIQWWSLIPKSPMSPLKMAIKDGYKWMSPHGLNGPFSWDLNEYNPQ